MTGSGNDFVFLDGRVARLEDWPSARIAAVCDRRRGVGADGVVLLAPEAPGTVRMHYYNSDGSRAAMCGNAALCSTRLAARLRLAPADAMCLATDAGAVPTRCVGGPASDLAEILLPPFTVPAPVAGVPLGPGERGIWFGVVGVPHAIVLVEQVDGVDLLARGRHLRFHAAFGPAGANVNFIEARDADEATGAAAAWPIRTYERGVEGETLACGTGTVAAAAAVAGAGLGTLPSTWITRSGEPLAVSGELRAGVASDVWLRGQGRLVYTAELADLT
jgi:diaminopimelate epimerase